jgi:hypothetical protein
MLKQVEHTEPCGFKRLDSVNAKSHSNKLSSNNDQNIIQILFSLLNMNKRVIVSEINKD